MRAGGGFGESVRYVTHESDSFKREWEGKSDAVCPSGPVPRQMRSNDGSLMVDAGANILISVCSYASAISDAAVASGSCGD